MEVKVGAIKIPKKLKRRFREIRLTLVRAGWRYCPVCETRSRRFATHGVDPREGARCDHCLSLERHRLVWLYFKERTDLFDGREKAVLHVAPEIIFQPLLLERLGRGYLSADLASPRAMVKMDITDIQYPDDAFDVIYCSHVLEHVPDDHKAMRELHRVLKPDGWAILLVPIREKVTQEDLSITDPEERTRLYGQHDHVRQYGADYVDRLRAAGFTVNVTRSKELYSAAERIRMGLLGQSIYYCTKEGGAGLAEPGPRDHASRHR